MPPSKNAPLLAPLARRRTQLMEKGVTRPRRKIAPRLPAGSSVLAGVPKGRDFVSAKKSGGGSVQKQIEKYCKAMRQSTTTFKEGNRAASTAAEHDMYVRLINCWAERSGFGTYAIERKGNADGTSAAMQIAREARSKALRVLKPEMIVGLLLEMATGDPNMPKGGHASDLARLAKSDSLNICGPRTQWKRKEGEFGSGPYSEEPWSLQAMEKRVYALRDFYKRELEGSSIDDPASDPLVTGTLKALVLLIGRKAMHVPRVSSAPMAHTRTAHRTHDNAIANADGVHVCVTGMMCGCGQHVQALSTQSRVARGLGAKAIAAAAGP